jgi:hypothetical protein
MFKFIKAPKRDEDHSDRQEKLPLKAVLHLRDASEEVFLYKMLSFF